MLKLLINDLKDYHEKENFRRIQDGFNQNPLTKGSFKFFAATFGLPTSTYPLTTTLVHNLGFLPKDVLQTSVIGGTLTWNYSAFTDKLISVTVSAQTTARFFLGRYEETIV